MSDPREPTGRRHWVFDTRINVGHVLTTLVLVAGTLGWGSLMERRVAVLEDRASRQEVAVAAMLQDLREEVRETNRKLDRLIERQTGASR